MYWISSSSSAGIEHSQEVHRAGPIRGGIDFSHQTDGFGPEKEDIDFDRGVDRSSAAEETLISVMKRLERAAEVKISQKCFQLQLADSENFKLTTALRNLISGKVVLVFLDYLAYTIRHFTLHDGRQRSACHYSSLSESPLFLFWSLCSHLKNVMENFNYGFCLAICKEGARNDFFCLQTCITLSLHVEIMLVKLNTQHPECFI
jgi:hypothetical protein